MVNLCQWKPVWAEKLTGDGTRYSRESAFQVFLSNFGMKALRKYVTTST